VIKGVAWSGGSEPGNEPKRRDRPPSSPTAAARLAANGSQGMLRKKGRRHRVRVAVVLQRLDFRRGSRCSTATAYGRCKTPVVVRRAMRVRRRTVKCPALASSDTGVSVDFVGVVKCRTVPSRASDPNWCGGALCTYFSWPLDPSSRCISKRLTTLAWAFFDFALLESGDLLLISIVIAFGSIGDLLYTFLVRKSFEIIPVGLVGALGVSQGVVVLVSIQKYISAT